MCHLHVDSVICFIVCCTFSIIHHVVCCMSIIIFPECPLWVEWKAYQFSLEVFGTYNLCCMTRQRWNGHDTWTHGKFFKIHMTGVSDTFRTRHGSIIEVSVLHSLQHMPEEVHAKEYNRTVIYYFFSFLSFPFFFKGEYSLVQAGPATRPLVR